MELGPLNYFLIFLAGFGVVWGHRTVFGKGAKPITDFEYAAFSALWGVLIFGAYMQFYVKGDAEIIKRMNEYPAVFSPTLFVIGVIIGVGSGLLVQWLNRIRITHFNGQ